MSFLFGSRLMLPVCGFAACAAISFDVSAAVIGTSAESRIDKTQSGTAGLSGGSLAFGTGNNVEFRTVLEFDLSGSSSDIALADTIELVFQIKGDANAGDAVNIQVINLDAGAADGTVASSDFAASGSLVTTLAASSIADEDVITVDVTSFVKEDLTASQTYSAFRLQGNTTIFDNGTYYFQAYKTSEAAANESLQAPVLNVVVPEPGSAALAGFGALALLGRRRAKRPLA